MDCGLWIVNFRRLKELENSLVDLAKTQGVQLDELNELLEENRRINAAMTVSTIYIRMLNMLN